MKTPTSRLASSGNRLSVLDDVPRSIPRARRENGRRPHGIRGRSGNAQSDPSHPAVDTGDGCGPDRFVSPGRLDDWLGKRAIRSQLAAALPAPVGVDGAGRARSQFYANAVAGIAIRGGIAMGYLQPPQVINYTSVTASAHSADPTLPPQR